MDPKAWNDLSDHEQSVLKEVYGENMPQDLSLESAKDFVKLVDARRGDPKDVLHFE